MPIKDTPSEPLNKTGVRPGTQALKDAKAKRLAEALRTNLRRRKAAGASPDAPENNED